MWSFTPEQTIRRIASFRRMALLFVFERKPFDEVWAIDHDGWYEWERLDLQATLLVRRCRVYHEDYTGRSYFTHGMIGRPTKRPESK